MSATTFTLPLGYSDVPAGHIASVVTDLEMRAPPAPSQDRLPEGLVLALMDQADPGAFRALFRKIGADWLWYSRLLMPDDELAAILDDSQVETFVIRQEGEDIGLLELDYRQPHSCELTFLGFIAGLTGKGYGRAVMNAAVRMAWSKDIRRMWVHTCSYDHPAALAFYIRSGFRPYATRIEVQVDPRLTGHLPRNAAAHVPIIEPRPTAE
ncbi:GNAT family N-acetyltransferase [Achromobacter insolitus]|uniref:GNAT family N-acetyltransferase n=1 Tax=Achromobacter insolitus TaxID=217204 RepID=UPI0020A2F6ED|nr:GNAT family N-acetyltransferase [Achromobacter insolitus]MCP1400376.1 GNAT superfamily N-acetyltransferase [Achromobacter insolitus]